MRRGHDMGEHHRHWTHTHTFGQDARRPGEARTRAVIALTVLMTVVEITAGRLLGSMALLADGLHMASHTVALGITAFAYAYARTHASDPRFSFGTGKVNALGGFTGAVLLGMFALLMAWESVGRLLEPVTIEVNQAIVVAAIGLAVNAASVLILGAHGHGHDHADSHRHAHDGHHHDHHHHHDGGDEAGEHHDHNLRSAYLHVMADALTSAMAIVALLTAKYFGWLWMDPVMGLVGAILVGRWSLHLVGSTCLTLLDEQAPDDVRRVIVASIERDGHSHVVDLHVWSIGPGLRAALVSVVAHQPATPDEYKARLPPHLGLAHASVEVHRCEAPGCATRASAGPDVPHDAAAHP